MTIPNLLTLGRIFLTPLVVWLILDEKLTAALAVFTFAGLSDALDGLLARALNQKSNFGAYMDPLADKFLLVTSFLILCYIGLVPLWLAIITVGRDIMILFGILALLLCRVKVEIKPLVSSKLTTLFQLTTVFLMLGSALAPLPQPAYTLLFLVTAGFSIYSGSRYFQIGMRLYRAHNETGGKT